MNLNHVTFFVTGKCNLDCAYCFERTQEWPRSDSDFEVAKQTVDFLISESGTERNLQIGFFGGEPLLRPEIIDFTCAYATEQGIKHGKSFNYSVTTNMTLINNEVLKMLKKYEISLLASIDGMPHADNVRYWQNTTISSATQALENLILAKDYGIHSQIRWTIAPGTMKYFSEDVISLVNLGFRNLAIEFVYETEVWAKEDYVILEEEIRKIAEFYIAELRAGRELYVKSINDGFNIFTMERRMTTRCGLGYSGVGISSSGEIFPCHRFVSRADWQEWSFGNVTTEFEREKRDFLVAEWDYNKIKVDDGRKCADCPIKLRCAGGICFPVHLDACGDFFTVPHCYCDIQRIVQRVSNDVLGILYGEQNPIMMKLLGQNQHSCNTPTQTHNNSTQ